MIKGYSMEEMLIISDNTPGIPYLCNLIIILLVIYAAYQLTQLYFDNQRKDKLEDCRSSLMKLKGTYPHGDDSKWKERVMEKNSEEKIKKEKQNKRKRTGLSQNEEISTSIERELKGQDLL